MIIVICGLRGTGKTTICKELINEFNFLYINDWTILKDKKANNLFLTNQFLKKNLNNNIIVDLDYENFEKTELTKLIKNENIQIYYLMFDINSACLIDKFDNNTSLNFMKISKNYLNECEKLKKTYFLITENRNKDIFNIFNFIKSNIKSKL